MASKNKWNKLKNAYLCWSFLKNNEGRLKRIFFFTPAHRKQLKKDLKRIIENNE